MKKSIPLAEIMAGMSFTEDAYIDERNLFIAAGVPVKDKDLEILRRWGVAAVLTEGQTKLPPSSAPCSEEKSCRELLAPGFAGQAALYQRYIALVEQLDLVFEKVRKGEVGEHKAVDQVTQGVLKLVREERDAAISAILASEVAEETLARSAVNIAVLAVVIGETLHLPPYKLAYLVAGALLHDIGMLRIPESILGKKGNLSEEEIQKIRAHPLLSYRIITKEFLYPDDIGLIGLQHHERWDGEGYPRKSAESDIDSLARIVSVADAFEAMVSVKPYRNSMIGYVAMKNLLSDNSRRFDPEILKAFIKSMGIYPLGSTVILNNAAIARVVEIHGEAPLRPKIRLIVDEFGNRSEEDRGEIIDLLAEKSLFIARALDPKELSEP